MRKLIKKAAILSLVLVLLLAASATAFAVTSWSHTWTAGDGETRVEYYAEITANNTQGMIDSGDNQGEVTVNADIYVWDSENERQRYHAYDTGTYYATVYRRCDMDRGEVRMSAAEYYFYAYVGSTGDEFQSGCVTLVP